MRQYYVWFFIAILLAGYAAFRLVQAGQRRPAAWLETAPGIEVCELTVKAAAGEIAVVAVRIAPARCALRAVDARHGVPDAGSTASDICPRDGAAINASFFGEDLTPIGLLVADGKRIRGFHASGARGLFLVQDGRPRLIKSTGKLPEGVEQAVESKPRLVVAGEIQSFQGQPAARRSAVALESKGRALFAASAGALTLEEWAACLRDSLGCVDALNLDGGPSAQLYVRGRFIKSIPNGWPVPVFLTAAPR